MSSPPPIAVVCLVADFEVPSFAGFPWGGLGMFALYATIAALAFALAVWMEEQQSHAAIPGMGLWFAGIAGLIFALPAGTWFLGPLFVPLAFLGLGGLAYGFAARRDKAVPPEERVLTKQLLSNVKQTLQARLAARRDRPVKAAVEKPKPASMVERLQQFSTLLERFGGRRGKKPKAEAGGNGVAPPEFKLLKKDGSPAIANTEGGSATQSENIQNVRKILISAMQAGATDVHIEPHEKEFFVRQRVDGVLQTAETVSMAAGKGLISTLKVASDMDIAERRRPQDGTFSALFGTDKYDIRSASTPTSYGEKMVLRLLNSSGGVMKAGLANIGLRTQIFEPLKEIIHKPYGMFLVVGPTGSGKTTTVYASLNEIDATQHNVTTIEDPVEYRLDGITQIAVNTAAGVTFAGILRSVLRQDPDVLLVGEIRDKETAEIACQAALTGHFVFSTLHANDTVATITRMLDLGLDPMLIQTAVTAVLGQRLARKLCMKCREAYPPPADLLKRLGLKPGAVPVIYKEKGCPECGGTGYKGRLGLHELLVFNDDIRKLITDSPSVEDLKAAARAAGTRSLQTDGFLKVLKGLTSLSEVVRVTT
jgi:type II secretory ATPase GspE/PulE/Tfp pilus assembly ATPase PilB-like protein